MTTIDNHSMADLVDRKPKNYDEEEMGGGKDLSSTLSWYDFIEVKNEALIFLSYDSKVLSPHKIYLDDNVYLVATVEREPRFGSKTYHSPIYRINIPEPWTRPNLHKAYAVTRKKMFFAHKLLVSIVQKLSNSSFLKMQLLGMVI